MPQKNNARLPDIATLIEAGIDPRTKLPIKIRMPGYEGIRAIIRVQDEQDAVNRFKWYRFPGLSSTEIERMIYYRGQLAFFNFDELETFCMLPFSLATTIDLYGRYNAIRPLQFGAANESEDREKLNGREKDVADLLSRKVLTVVKEVLLPDEAKEFETTGAVILRDYTPQLSRQIIPRAQLNDPLMDLEARCLPYMRTALSVATGVRGLRVNTEDEKAKALDLSYSLDEAALKGWPYIPIVGAVDFQDISNGTVGHAEEFLLAMQALDNIRLGTHGIENGGIFQKKAHELQTENDMTASSQKSSLIDALNNRRRFCDIVNSIWGLGVWCDINTDDEEIEEDMEEDQTDDTDPDVGEREEKQDGLVD